MTTKLRDLDRLALRYMEEPASVGELATWLKVTPSTVYGSLARLDRAGLITKTPQPRSAKGRTPLRYAVLGRRPMPALPPSQE